MNKLETGGEGKKWGLSCLGPCKATKRMVCIEEGDSQIYDLIQLLGAVWRVY